MRFHKNSRNIDCAVPGCPGQAIGPDKPYCRVHWHVVPDDLRERLRESVDDTDDLMDFACTLEAINAELRRGP